MSKISLARLDLYVQVPSFSADKRGGRHQAFSAAQNVSSTTLSCSLGVRLARLQGLIQSAPPASGGSGQPIL